MVWKKIQWSDDVGFIAVRKNSGANIGIRQRLNFIEGSNITLAISDDPAGSEVDISIAATQYSHPSARQCTSGNWAWASITGKPSTYPPSSHGASSHTDRTRTFLVTAHHYTTGDETSTGVALDPSTVQNVVYRFALPKDFVSLTSVDVVWTVDTYNTSNKNIVLDISSKYGTPSHSFTESYSTHTGSDSNNVIPISAYARYWQWMFVIDSSVFSSIAQGDFVILTVERDADHASDTFTNDIKILGLIVEYTADM